MMLVIDRATHPTVGHALACLAKEQRMVTLTFVPLRMSAPPVNRLTRRDVAPPGPSYLWPDPRTFFRGSSQSFQSAEA
jgi:hypothetical protein